MTSYPDGHRVTAIAIVALVLAPVWALVVYLAPVAIAIGWAGVRYGYFAYGSLLLLWAGGLIGLIALSSAVLPVALGWRRDCAVGVWRQAGLLGGAVVSVVLLTIVLPSLGPPGKAYVWWWAGYCAVSALVAAIRVLAHDISPAHTP